MLPSSSARSAGSGISSAEPRRGAVEALPSASTSWVCLHPRQSNGDNKIVILVIAHLTEHTPSM